MTENTNNEILEQIDDEHRRYCEYRSSLLGLAAENQKEVDRLYLTFGTIFFAVSMAFIKDIVNLEAACYKPLLIMSWLSFLMVVILSGAAGFASSRSAMKQYWFYDAYYQKHERLPDVEPREPEALANDKKHQAGNAVIRGMSYGAAAAFPLALLLLIVFIAINI